MRPKPSDAPGIAVQKELMETYEEASRGWLARVQAEIALWSELSAKLSGSRSLPEVLDAYQKCAAQRVQMAAEDGKQLLQEYQRITQMITQSLSVGWRGGTG